VRGASLDRLFIGTNDFLKLGARNIGSSVLWWLIGTASFLIPMRIFGRAGLDDFLSSFIVAATFSGVIIIFMLPSGTTGASVKSSFVAASINAVARVHEKLAAPVNAN
jgi:hypothetical protein